MTIVHKLLPDGGFVAGDTHTGRTSYAYPTSPSAKLGRKQPGEAAADMMRRENAISAAARSVGGQDYDARNWARLDAQPEGARP